MQCLACGTAGVAERPAQGCRRFRCCACGKRFNERNDAPLNPAQYPNDVIAFAVLWRLRYKLSLRNLTEMFLIRGIVFSHEGIRKWEVKLTPALAENLRRRRRGHIGRSWYVNETNVKVLGEWRYLYRTVDRDRTLVGWQSGAA
jgi:putative transposase